MGTWDAGRRDTAGHSRRRLLRAGVGLAVAAAVPPALGGCGLFDDDPAPVPPPDPLTPLLAETLRLAEAYDSAARERPGLAERLAPIGAAHRAHATELTRLVNPPASPSTPAGTASASPADPAGDDAAVLATLRGAEEAGQRTAAEACRQAPAARAALLGSIAAARATHAEVLR